MRALARTSDDELRLGELLAQHGHERDGAAAAVAKSRLVKECLGRVLHGLVEPRGLQRSENT